LRLIDYLVFRLLRKSWVFLREWDQGYFFSLFDSYDLRQPVDILFDRDLRCLGSPYFYYVLICRAPLHYTRVLALWFIRLGPTFYMRVLRLLTHRRHKSHPYLSAIVFMRQRRRLFGTMFSHLFYFLDPYFRLFSLGFSMLSSFLPGLYEDAPLHDIKGISGGRIPRQLPGASDYQLYREFEPHHIRDMCLAYYELPWGEGYRERRSFFLNFYGPGHSDRMRSVAHPPHIRTWPRMPFFQRTDWWALWGVDLRGRAGWDSRHTQATVSYLLAVNNLTSYLYLAHLMLTPPLLSYFYFV